MAVWAVARLLPPEEFAALAHAAHASERDPDVQAEWKAAG